MRNDTGADANQDRYLVRYNKIPYIIYSVISAVICIGLFLMLKDDIEYDLSITHSYSRLLILLGFCGLFLLINLCFFAMGIYTKEYMIMFDDKGIANNMAGAKWKFIPWEDIAGFESRSSFGHVYLGIKIIDEEKYTRNASAFGRLRTKHQKFFSDCLFEIDFVAAVESPCDILPELEKRLKKYNKNVSLSQKAGADSKYNIQYDDGAVASRSIPKAKALILGLIAVNIIIFAANLYISNHCWIIVDYHTLVTLFRHGALDTLWLSEGILPFSELLWYGPETDLGLTLFGLDTSAVFAGHNLHTLFTYAFLHADIIHLVSNMVVLYYFSSMVFANFGKKEFAIWYASGILGGALATLIKAAITGKTIYAVGASAAIFGLLGGLLSPLIYTLLKTKSMGGKIEAIDRRKIFESLCFIFMMIIPGFFEENVSWEGHIGGVISGLVAGIVLFAIRERKNRLRSFS